MPCRVVVVWEELSQKEAHVLALWAISIVILATTVAICLVMLAWALEIAKIASSTAFHVTIIMLYTATFLIDEISSRMRPCILLGRFEAIVPIREHLSCKRLSHDRLTTLSSRLC